MFSPPLPHLAGLLLLAAGQLLAPRTAKAQAPAAVPAVTAPTPNDVFQARVLLALSDADMVPSAYIDGKLGPIAGSDVLNVVAFDGRKAGPPCPFPAGHPATSW